MFELGQPIARLRPRQAHRRHHRAPGRSRGRRSSTLDDQTAQAARRGPADHRRLRPDRPGRRHGRGRHRDLRHDDQRADRSRELRPDLDRPHRAPPQAAERGVEAVRARCRPAGGVRRSRARRRAARRTGRRNHRAARLVAATTRRHPRPIVLPRRLRRRPGRGRVHRRRDRAPRSRRSVPCSKTWTAACRSTPPSWRPDLTDEPTLAEEVARIVGYDRIPSVLPVAPPGAWPDPLPAAAPSRGEHARRRTG